MLSKPPSLSLKICSHLNVLKSLHLLSELLLSQLQVMFEGLEVFVILDHLQLSLIGVADLDLVSQGIASEVLLLNWGRRLSL